MVQKRKDTVAMEYRVRSKNLKPTGASQCFKSINTSVLQTSAFWSVPEEKADSSQQVKVQYSEQEA